MDNLIDARGQACPKPVILAKQKIDAKVESFQIIVDNETAVKNIEKLAHSVHYNMNTNKQPDGFYIDLSLDSCECEEVAQISQNQTPANRWTLFVTENTIGIGADKLGSSLMRAFFYTLTQSSDYPSTVIFMNQGAKLPVEDSQIIEHLQFLTQKGCEILVCGTCLDFYGIKDKLTVGNVSNMYEIVEKLKQSPKVIKL